MKIVICDECRARTTEKISDSYYDEYYTDDEIAKLWNRRTEYLFL